jgi:hypothetical protein
LSGLVVVAVVLVIGCDGDAVSPVPDSGQTACVPASGKLDLLLVVDTSGDSAAFQDLLESQLATFLGAVLTGDLDSDGASDLTPPSSVHVGAISADMGAGSIRNCEGDGDRGGLLTEGMSSPSCVSSYPPFQTLAPGDSVADASNALRCVAFRTDGCGVEQPLESFGAALLVNEGFFRSDATLAVVVVTKEDDCSAADPLLFEPDGPYEGSTLEELCVLNESALHTTERYVSAVSARYDPRSVVYALLAGIPSHLETRPAQEVLDDPALQIVSEPAAAIPFQPSCRHEAMGIAFAPRRLLEMAVAFEEQEADVTLGSVCEDAAGYRETLLRFAGVILRSASRTCPPASD